MKAIVCLVNRNGNYVKALARLEESLKGNFYGDFFGFIGEKTVGAPLHSDNPYAFKLYTIEYIRNMGYDQVLWLDSSVFAVKDVQPIFDVIDSKGYFMQEAGAYAGEWCNDSAKEYFQLTVKECRLPLYSAGITGLNFLFKDTKIFFNNWKESMKAGCFKGLWTNHRHDLVCASIIAQRMRFEYEKGDKYVQYWSEEFPEPKNESICLMLKGL